MSIQVIWSIHLVKIKKKIQREKQRKKCFYICNRPSLECIFKNIESIQKNYSKQIVLKRTHNTCNLYEKIMDQKQ